jgi:DNA-binding transcriptional ArsR family regulator
MARLFPFRSEPQTGEGQPRVVDLEGEDADAVFGALSSTTARRIYARLDSEPGTPSDVADAIDSSIQNVRYHLENLEDAGLVEVVDTWYSSRGNEMSVYATTDGPLIVASDESKASQLRTALSRLIGGIGALAGGSLLVQYGLTDWFGAAGTSQDEAAPAGGEDADEPDGDAAAGEDADADEPDDDAAGDDANEEFDEESADDGTADDGTDDEVSIADTDDEGDQTAADEGAEEAEASDDLGDETAADERDTEEDEPTDHDADGTESAADDTGVAETFFDGGPEAVETAFGAVPPGLLFFLGGLAVLLAVTAYWYWHRPAY